MKVTAPNIPLVDQEMDNLELANGIIVSTFSLRFILQTKPVLFSILEQELPSPTSAYSTEAPYTGESLLKTLPLYSRRTILTVFLSVEFPSREKLASSLSPSLRNRIQTIYTYTKKLQTYSLSGRYLSYKLEIILNYLLNCVERFRRCYLCWRSSWHFFPSLYRR